MSATERGLLQIVIKDALTDKWRKLYSEFQGVYSLGTVAPNEGRRNYSSDFFVRWNHTEKIQVYIDALDSYFGGARFECISRDTTYIDGGLSCFSSASRQIPIY
jgi:hypothetical protein